MSRFANPQLLIALAIGVASVLAHLVLGSYVHAETARSTAQAGADALAAIGLGGVLTTYLQRREDAREAVRQSAIRAGLLDRMAVNVRLTATGWMNIEGDVAIENVQKDIDSTAANLKERQGRLADARLALNHGDTPQKRAGNTWVSLQRIASEAAAYEAWGSRAVRFEGFAGLRQTLESVARDASPQTRAQLLAFLAAMDRAFGARVRSDAWIRRDLRGPGGRNLLGPSSEHDASVTGLVRDVAARAGNAIDPVGHLALLCNELFADFVRRLGKRGGELPDTWCRDVRQLLNDGTRAVELELEEVRATLWHLGLLTRELAGS